MASLFSRIINGEIPGRFVWEDDDCVGFLTINPVTAGHTLVVSRTEVDRWTDAPEELVVHVMTVARLIGRAQQTEWDSPRVALAIQGYEIPHFHVHVWPTFKPADFDFRQAVRDPEPAEMDAAMERLRSRLRDQGNRRFVPSG